ncbi:hypothetical protein ABEB36_004320 [Hypothenemus hampei]|uniref:Ionotropic receptor n=1 Tax=Hypothenemus hampei TaxID=57062 RepID=A0ABD1F300_HYPHA
MVVGYLVVQTVEFYKINISDSSREIHYNFLNCLPKDMLLVILLEDQTEFENLRKAASKEQRPFYNFKFQGNDEEFMENLYNLTVKNFILIVDSIEHLNKQVVVKYSFHFTVLQIYHNLDDSNLHLKISRATFFKTYFVEHSGTVNFFNNCLEITSLLVPPWNTVEKLRLTYFKSSAAFEDNHVLQGFDVNLMKLLLHYIHMPAVYITPLDRDTFGNNINFSGAFGQVARGEADMAVNSRIYSANNRLVNYIYPRIRDDVIIIVPKRDVEYNLLNLTKPELGLILAVFVIFLLYTRIFNNVPLGIILLDIILILTGKPIQITSYLKLKWFRLTYITVMGLAYFAYILFSIQLFSQKAQKSSTVKVDTMEQVVSSDIKILVRPGLISDVENALQYHPLRKQFLSKVTSFPFGPNELVTEWQLMVNCDQAVVCRKSTFQRFTKELHRKFRKICYDMVKEPLIPSFNSYIISFENPFFDRLNKGLIIVSETGLLFNKTALRPEKEITFYDIYGKKFQIADKQFWIYYCTSMAVSVVVFVLELLMGLWQFKRISGRKMWHY